MEIKINKKTIKNKTLFQVNEMTGINYWCIVEKDKYGNKTDVELELNPIQTKVLKIALAMIEPKNEIQDEYSFTVKEIMNIVGLGGHRTEFEDMPNFLRTIMKHDRFEYRQNDNKDITVFHIFDKASYFDSTKTFTFTFSFEMIRKLNCIPKNEIKYTGYPVIEILEFGGKYDIQLFEIFKMNSFRPKFEIELTELKYRLNIGDKYKVYNDFKRKILNPALKKIKETKCIKVELIDEKRLGRKIGVLVFKITKKDLEPKEYMIVENIVPELKPYEYKNLYIMAKKDINIITEKYNMIKDNKDIKSMYKYLLYAIDNDIKEIPKKSNSTFNNFEQRTYDFDELERKLLGWEN